jgi:hypothetical protein
MLKNPAEYDRDTSSAKFKEISRQLPASLLDVSVTTTELWWMIQEWLGRIIDKKMAAGRAPFCKVPLRNSNQ